MITLVIKAKSMLGRFGTLRNEFEMRNMGCYHGFLLKTDVLLLADVCEESKSPCFEYYGLDARHYFSIPGLSWDVILKMTGLKLDLITGDMFHFIEKI